MTRAQRASPDTNGGGAPLRVRLLGDFQVCVGDAPIGAAAWPLRKAAAIVKLLALAPGHSLHREQIMDALWPDLDPAAAAHNLNQSLYVARRVLDPSSSRPPAFLQRQADQIVLSPHAPVWTDAQAFSEAAALARQTQDPQAYRAALDLCSGSLLPEDRYEPWADVPRQQTQDALLSLATEAAALYEARGHYAEAIDALQQAVAVDPAHEDAHAGLMRLYALTGQRSRALRQHQQLCEALRREVDAEPDDATERLWRDIVAGRFPARDARDDPPQRRATSPAAPLHNLPAFVTSFVGREAQLADIRALLSRHRLLTLTGTGGTGKTRLAIRVATAVAAEMPDGAWLVDLSALTDEALVPQQAAVALRVREVPGQPLTATIASALAARRLLLLLDNCEHLIGACARFADALLRACPDLRILATSRQPLGVAGEARYHTPPLAVPPQGRPATDGRRDESLPESEALRLFSDRARLVQPSFSLTSANARAVADVCAQLDGLPLAIELAAARMNVLSVEQIAQRLSDRFRVLVGGSRTSPARHQTLRQTVAWSYDLLDPPEQAFFARLSAFTGGFSLRAVEAVGAGPGLDAGDVLDLLSQLVDKSLVLAEASDSDGVRYRLLETLRQFGLERLAEREADDAAATRQRHARYYLALAEESERMLAGPQQSYWLTRLEQDHDNLRAALDWSAREGGDIRIGLRIAGALARFWWVRGHFGEGRERIESLLRLPVAAPRGAERAKALYALGVLTFRHADYAANDQQNARACFEESLSIYRELADQRQVAGALRELGRIAIELGEYDVAQPLLDESLELELALGDRHAIALSQSSLGWLALFQGDHDAARRWLEPSLAVFREVGDALYVAICSFFLARLSCDQGDFDAAREWLSGILDGLSLEQFRWGAPFILEGFARVAAAQGQAARALTLASAASSLRAGTGASVGPSWQADLARRLEPARRALTLRERDAATAAGQSLSLQEAIDLALAAAPA